MASIIGHNCTITANGKPVEFADFLPQPRFEWSNRIFKVRNMVQEFSATWDGPLDRNIALALNCARKILANIRRRLRKEWRRYQRRKAKQ